MAPEAGSPWALASEQAQAVRRKRSRTPIAASIAGAVVLVVVAVGIWLVVTSDAGGGSQPGPTTSIAAPDLGAPSPPIAFTTTVEADGVRFAWTNPSPAEGDAFVVRSDPSSGDPIRETIVQPEIVVPIDPDGQTCVAVAVQRTTGMQSDYEEHCVDA